ncbi:Signal transduction histidine kinase [Flavobacterium saliperosum S13]|uniref:histidine kinase n=2 Tax=Flavobacterium saliperosum TaxID=329186 RepID=A0A1G4VKC1_9FLAO|nr:ATP-binding protein [Flavobacterium saliperosum]ESU25608.1 Signal transduction histidine kinase [Flavobacterium saliperosum S13]SCX08057.1 Signal transduction histidine kinase [Flavobacterium saliperosum]
MNFIRLNFFVSLILLIFQGVHAQSEKVDRTSVLDLLSKSGESLHKLECSKSLVYAKNALNKAYQIEDNRLIARSYNLIGLNFEEFSDFNKAEGYYTKGIKFANLTTNDTLKGWLHNNLGNLYCYRKVNFEKGINHYKKALVYSQNIKDTLEITYSNLNIAAAHFSKEQYALGLPYLEVAAPLVKKLDLLEAKLSLNSLYGSYYTFKNDFQKAEASFKEAIKLCNTNDVNFLESHASEVYDDFSRYYFKVKDYKNAYLYLEKYNELKDKIYTSERTNEVNTAGSNIELDEYKREIDKIENEKLVQSDLLKQTKLLVIMFIFIFIILLLLVYALYRSNQLRKKSNKKLKVANEELLIAKEQAEEASLLKSQFISTITHELRTPLYGVVGITDMIADEHKELQNSTYLKSLKFSAKYLLSLVNDILQVYKIEEKKIVLESSIFNLSDELTSIVESLQFLAVKNNNKLRLEVDEAIPEFIIGDKVRLSQIFMNLVSNSLKFTKDGNVKIIARLERNEASFCFVTFTVMDDGIGIAKEHQQKIFEKFVQIERKEDDYQGTGLGLSIVKQLVTLYGSEIHCESEENVGTKMFFTIGFDTDEVKRNDLLKNLEVDFSEERTYKILVVEDNKINQIVTKKILDIRHFESVIVDDGYEALKTLENEDFDVILMDINMPKINGFDTSKLIRKSGITTPIIAVTAFDKQEIIEQVRASKMNEVIVKPFEPNHLYKMIIQISNKNEEELKAKVNLKN